MVDMTTLLLASILGIWNLTGMECSSGAAPDLSQLPAVSNAVMTVNTDTVHVAFDASYDGTTCHVAGNGTYTLKNDQFTPDFPAVDISCDGQTDALSIGALSTTAKVDDSTMRVSAKVSGLNACPAADEFVLVFARQ